MEGRMPDLASKVCEPCTVGTPVLKGAELEALHGELHTSWRVIDEHHLERDYKFKNFREALAFTNRVGELAETLGHHPDIHLAWGKVRLQLWTHKIGGLSTNDFVLAGHIDQLATGTTV
jgi:4a-hydroxytetrahydrobiopterin dehydratase